MRAGIHGQSSLPAVEPSAYGNGFTSQFDPVSAEAGCTGRFTRETVSSLSRWNTIRAKCSQREISQKGTASSYPFLSFQEAAKQLTFAGYRALRKKHSGVHQSGVCATYALGDEGCSDVEG